MNDDDNDTLRLALLQLLAEKREGLTYDQITYRLRRHLAVKGILLDTLYSREIRPELLWLGEQKLVTEVRVSTHDGICWQARVTRAGKALLTYRRVTPFAEVIARMGTLSRYSFQSHFLDLLDGGSAEHAGEHDLDPLEKLFDTSFDPAKVLDERRRALKLLVQRQGQPEFRQRLLEIYGYTCAITGCDAVDALEAAHITPYKGTKANHLANGLILRADIHTLFDLGLIAVDTATMTVVVAPKLQNTVYQRFQGTRLRVPTGHRMSKHALDEHRAWGKTMHGAEPLQHNEQ